MHRPRVPSFDPPPAKRRAAYDRSEPTAQSWQQKLLKAKACIPQSAPPASVPEPVLDDPQWHYNEADFHLEQAKLRSHIRLEQGRETRFDLCLQLQRLFQGEIDVSSVTKEQLPKEMSEPYLILEEAGKSELEAVQSAIEVHCALEKSDWTDYWKSLSVLCEERIHLLCAQEEAEEKQLRYYTLHGLAQDIYEDLNKILSGKSEQDLETLRTQVETALRDPSAAIDRTHFEGVLVQTKVYLAKAALRRLADKFISQKVSGPGNSAGKIPLKDLILYKGAGLEPEYDPDMSPTLQSTDCFATLIEDAVVVTEAEDVSQQAASRAAILEKEMASFMSSSKRLDLKANPLIAQDTSRFNIVRMEKLHSETMERTMEDLVRVELLKNLPAEEGEEEFGQVVDVKPVLESWMSKYRARKPKFFNRVKTGYEWNKYNQTHYDHTSPPPKVVQGYKFNIFYPDLIDKAKAPQFYLEPCENSDLCIIRFHAGPPYEDIAFQIVSREWDYSERRGFKNFFDRGVLHLYVNFKRHRYKR